MKSAEDHHRDIKDYFYVHIFILKLIGVPVKPLDESWNVVLKCLYYIYSIVFILIIPMAFTFSETYQSIINIEDFDKSSFGLSYSLTHMLGRCAILKNSYV